MVEQRAVSRDSPGWVMHLKLLPVEFLAVLDPCGGGMEVDGMRLTQRRCRVFALPGEGDNVDRAICGWCQRYRIAEYVLKRLETRAEARIIRGQIRNQHAVLAESTVAGFVVGPASKSRGIPSAL